MTTHAVPLVAAVTANEQAILDRAAGHLADALSRAAGESWSCPCTFAAEPQAPDGAVLVTSLLPALADLDRPWPAVEQALHATYKALGESGSMVMILTILRHVDATEEAGRAAHLRRRIRKLNLLATELSRQYGAFVIDLDRALADVGGRHLKTDFRLGGSLAAEFASKIVALSIATNALDAFVAVKIQDKACAILEGERAAVGLATEQMMTDVIAFGQGRRRQRVATLTDSVAENHVGWLVRQVLKRQIGGREALGKLAAAVRRRGARESAMLLITGVSRMLKPAEAGRR